MDDQLKTFIAVADNHSFNKAASQLFISAPAVIKQINTLEKNIKVTLFNRTHSGVTLTKAGKSFYQDAIKLLDAYNQSINRAQEMTEKQTIKIGAGPLATGTETNNIWIEIGKKNPDLTFQFIPCACSLGDFNKFLGGIGNIFDLVSSIYDENLLREYNLQALELDITPLKLSIPITHPLIKKDQLSLSDLNNQTIVLPQKDKFACFDKAREFLQQNPTITIQDVPGLNMNVLNQCATNNWLLCSAEDWQAAHPLLQAKTVNWTCSAPFGIVYSKNPSPVIREVINFLEKRGTNAHD